MAFQDVSSANLSAVNEATSEKFDEVDAEGGTLLLDNGRRCESAKYRIPGFAQGSGRGYANANGIYVLTLNCDERRLSIMFPNGPQHDDMDVDLLRTPFPWRFCVQLSRLGGCLSLV
ncbi:unnamed protein product [Adineta steineri]|uniref:Uncharacterized protein n=1 Tax=Adineta steineri TaxID=433720 RepID=A0A815SWL8_9BILA|nr:unnamed protein product [Adineta steineri]CAF1497284.1 unnamed protein product [Adineta steineri]